MLEQDPYPEKTGIVVYKNSEGGGEIEIIERARRIMGTFSPQETSEYDLKLLEKVSKIPTISNTLRKKIRSFLSSAYSYATDKMGYPRGLGVVVKKKLVTASLIKVLAFIGAREYTIYSDEDLPVLALCTGQVLMEKHLRVYVHSYDPANCFVTRYKPFLLSLKGFRFVYKVVYGYAKAKQLLGAGDHGPRFYMGIPRFGKYQQLPDLDLVIVANGESNVIDYKEASLVAGLPASGEEVRIN